jgi:hypothetical protein
MYGLRKEPVYRHINADNYTDMCYIHLVPKQDVATLFSIFDLMQSSDVEEDLMDAAMTNFTLHPNKEFIIFDDIPNLGNFSEEQKTTAAGDAFDIGIEYALNKDDYEQRTTLFRYLKHRELIAVCFFQSGSIRIAGSLERGADFKYKYESSKGICQIQLNWQSEEPCLHLLGESTWMPTPPTPSPGSGNKPLTGPLWFKGMGNTDLANPQEGDWRIVVNMSTGDFHRENYFNSNWEMVASDQKFI